MNDRLFGALGLCRKAGALTGGFDAVCEAAAKGAAVLVLLAADASERTRRKINESCQGRCPVAEIDLEQADLAAIMGKPYGVLAVTDKNLGALCAKAINV